MNREEAIDKVERTQESYYDTNTHNLVDCLTTDECVGLVNEIFDHHEAKTQELICNHSKAMKLLKSEYEVRLIEVRQEVESRTCEGCLHLRGIDKNSKCNFGYLPNNLYEDDFGCNKWEVKK